MTGPRNDRPPGAVGDRFGAGQVSGGVNEHGVWVNCSLLGTGVTVELDPDGAEVFAEWLVVWARRARAANRKG